MRLLSSGCHVYADFDVFGRFCTYMSSELGDQQDAGLLEIVLPAGTLDCVVDALTTEAIEPQLDTVMDVLVSDNSMVGIVTTRQAILPVARTSGETIKIDISKRLQREQI